MKSTPYKIRNNEIYGDLTAWLTAHAGDNESDLMRLKRNLRLAREEELTPRQRELLRLRYHEESCGGLNYRRSSEETTDPCLSEIFLELSRDEYRHARHILSLLEKQMPI